LTAPKRRLKLVQELLVPGRRLLLKLLLGDPQRQEWILRGDCQPELLLDLLREFLCTWRHTADCLFNGQAPFEHRCNIPREEFMEKCRQIRHGLNPLFDNLIGLYPLKGLSVFRDRPPERIEPHHSINWKLPSKRDCAPWASL
jgi:hypothetical protein